VVAVNNGADVINVSSSSNSIRPSLAEAAAIAYASARQVVIVAAAGNRPTQPARFPAAYSDVISVTATDKDGSNASYATHEGAVDIAATGTVSWRASESPARPTVRGTSYASPVVAAAAALLKARDPDIAPSQVKRVLTATAARPDPETRGQHPHEAGRLSIVAALRALAGMQLVVARA
jgi:subtilisin family serine protease